jgi:hypothetical protein
MNDEGAHGGLSLVIGKPRECPSASALARDSYEAEANVGG